MKFTREELEKDVAALEDARRLVAEAYQPLRRMAAQHGQGAVIDLIADPILTALDRSIDRLRDEVRRHG